MEQRGYQNIELQNFILSEKKKKTLMNKANVELVAKTKKYQMAIRHCNKYRITMESNPQLPNLYSFTPFVFDYSITNGRTCFIDEFFQ